MKNICYLFIVSFLVFSCEKEDLQNETEVNNQDVLSQKSDFVFEATPVAWGLSEHQWMLYWNSIIIGEMIKDDVNFRNQVLSLVNPFTHTVPMSSIIDFSTENYLSYAYRYYAENSIIYNPVCEPDVILPFPPLIGVTGYAHVSSISENLVNNMIQHSTELYIPNTTVTGDIFTVGHPLIDVPSNNGVQIFIQERNVPCYMSRFFTDAIINPRIVQEQNAFVIVSRPTASSLINYSYINVDINRFLSTAPTGGVNTTVY